MKPQESNFQSQSNFKRDSPDTRDLQSDGQQLARWALDSWTATTGIQFVEVIGPAEITFFDDSSGAWGGQWAYSGHVTTQGVVNVSTDWVAAYGTIDQAVHSGKHDLFGQNVSGKYLTQLHAGDV